MKNLDVLISKANILMEALPYIKEFAGITVVIKYGGSAVVDDDVKSTVVADVALMKYVGLKPVVVHGGGPEINALLARLGIKSAFEGGLRVTDEQTMEAAEMALSGKIGKQLAAELCAHGVKAVGISGRDASTLEVEKLTPNGADIGFVGDPKKVDTQLLKTLIDNDFVPVVSPIGFDGSGRIYNVNADYAAVAVAGALGAEKLVFLTDVDGVLSDPRDKTSVMSRLDADTAERMIADGTIGGGMIPKVECCLKGVAEGVRQVHILNGRVAHCLILEIFTKQGVGTLIEAGAGCGLRNAN